MKDVKKTIANVTNVDGSSTNIEELSDEKGFTLESRRKVVCVQFLQSIGVELRPAEDPVRQERLRKMDQHLQNMSIK